MRYILATYEVPDSLDEKIPLIFWIELADCVDIVQNIRQW